MFHFITSSCHSVFEGCLHDTSSHWRIKTITICKWLCIVSYGGLWNFIILFEISYTWHSRRLFINLYFFNLYPYSFWLHIKALDRWIECKTEERLKQLKFMNWSYNATLNYREFKLFYNIRSCVFVDGGLCKLFQLNFLQNMFHENYSWLRK